MILWQAKANVVDEYTTMPTPKSYKLDFEDYDKDSYRSVNNADLNRNKIVSKMLKASFNYRVANENELKEMLTMINNYPLYLKLKSPYFTSDGSFFECNGYVAKVSVEAERNLETGAEWSNISFNFVQGKKTSKQ